MPIHDWTRVDAGIFHHFHHAWIEQITRRLNAGLLPPDYYALAEQHAGGFGPVVLTLQGGRESDEPPVSHGSGSGNGARGVLAAPPRARLVGETDLDFYRRKQSVVTVRHVSGDRVVAVVEVVSPGNKSTRRALASFVDKAAELLQRDIHLLILDLLPPGAHDPRGIHAAIWDEVAGQEFTPPAGKPLTLAAYESAVAIRAYVEPVAVGDALPEMPLFLVPGGHVPVPLDETYQSAWEAVPARWRRVVAPANEGNPCPRPGPVFALPTPRSPAPYRPRVWDG
jgi:hypothetical protein